MIELANLVLMDRGFFLRIEHKEMERLSARISDLLLFKIKESFEAEFTPKTVTF